MNDTVKGQVHTKLTRNRISIQVDKINANTGKFDICTYCRTEEISAVVILCIQVLINTKLVLICFK